MTIYTVVAYRPDHVDYCRGCYMGGSPSDLEIKSADNQNDVAEFIADKRMEDRSCGTEYAEWETYILIDGLHADDSLVSGDDIDLIQALCSQIYKLSDVHVKQLIEEEKIRQEEERKRKRIERQIENARKAEENAAKEIAEYERLKAKYGSD